MTDQEAELEFLREKCQKQVKMIRALLQVVNEFRVEKGLSPVSEEMFLEPNHEENVHPMLEPA